jgi:hypothetical protein
MSSITGLQTTFNDIQTPAFIGSLSGKPQDCDPMINADVVSMPFGTPVAYKPSPTTDLDGYIPAASTDRIAGILFRSDAYSRAWTDENGSHGELDGTGVTAGSVMQVARKGKIYVTCVTGCTPGDRVFISYAVGGPYTAKGQYGNATQASTTLDDHDQGQWVSTAAAGQGAWLEFDFVNI